MESTFALEHFQDCIVLRIRSEDSTNRLARSLVLQMNDTLAGLSSEKPCKPLVIAGNEKFFSAGADLNELFCLNGPAAFEFSKMGQELMTVLDCFPAPTFAAISGYCMGGGLDLALACRYRVASPDAVFGHRGAALGLITGWGGTQRLPRLIGKGRALGMLIVAEKISAKEALEIGLIDAIAEDPVAECVRRAKR